MDCNKENIVKMQANWFVTFSAKVLQHTICVHFGSKWRLQFDRQAALWRNYLGTRLRIQPNAKTVCEAVRCNTTNHFRSSTRHEKDFERRELAFLWNCRTTRPHTTRFFRYKTHHNEPETVVFLARYILSSDTRFRVFVSVKIHGILSKRNWSTVWRMA